MLAAVFSITAALLTPTVAHAAPDQTFYPPYGVPQHGWRVYLSPAFHGTTPGVPADNTGCFGYSENSGARQIAFLVKDHLVANGFTVRIGGDNASVNTSRSNAWGPNFHIPIHSNAGGWNCGWDVPGYSSSGGTVVMYASSGGQQVSNYINFFLGPKTPGPHDRVCTDVACSGRALGELRNTNAVSSYVETAFHTDGADTLTLAFDQSTLAQHIFAGIYYYIVDTWGPPGGVWRAGASMPSADEVSTMIAERDLPPLPAPPTPVGRPDPGLNAVLPELRGKGGQPGEPDHSHRLGR